ncbi:hypothetical protein EDD86DRAFT_199686 [Gorgonomyces haynaldii]|nr:hypothetical protein EDD86DRAFT_199686 [Gorgonomyces haynaldii]
MKFPLVLQTPPKDESESYLIPHFYSHPRQMGTSTKHSSLYLQTLLEFCHFSYQYVEWHQEEFGLPSLVTPEGIKTGQEMMDHITRNARDIDVPFTKDDQNAQLAYVALIDTKLVFCFEYESTLDWQDLLSEKYPFPLNYIVPWRDARLKRKQLQSISPVLLDQKIYQDCATCLQTLETKLGDSLYLFGSKPSKADARLFSILFIIMSIAKPSKLKDLVLKHDLLVKYTKRVWTTWFAKPEHQSLLDKAQPLKLY